MRMAGERKIAISNANINITQRNKFGLSFSICVLEQPQELTLLIYFKDTKKRSFMNNRQMEMGL